jgi:hypothetical protein
MTYGEGRARGLVVKKQVEAIECMTCGAWEHCSCIVPDPAALDVIEVYGRHFHWSRVADAWEMVDNRCCARFEFGDGTHDLNCRMARGERA